MHISFGSGFSSAYILHQSISRTIQFFNEIFCLKFKSRLTMNLYNLDFSQEAKILKTCLFSNSFNVASCGNIITSFSPV